MRTSECRCVVMPVLCAGDAAGDPSDLPGDQAHPPEEQSYGLRTRHDPTSTAASSLAAWLTEFAFPPAAEARGCSARDRLQVDMALRVEGSVA